ncbi:hypothetical protein ACVBEJ_04690 [Porticoccus sp. GXU_MW_L64]
MRGRAQAIAVAFAGSLLLPYISLAAVGLVTLRKGIQEGSLVLLCSLIAPLLLVPAGVPLAVMVALFVATMIAAVVLRSTRSWTVTLLAVSAISTLIWLLLGAMSEPGELSAQLLQNLEMFALSEERMPWLAALKSYSDGEWAAIFASVTALELLFCLLLARWWQALLYNPGGFRTEFHQLRFSRGQAMSLVVAILLCTLVGNSWQLWVNVFALPLLIAAIALVHWLVAERNLGVQTLIMFYVGLILVMPLFVPVLVVAAFTDSIVNLRRYLRKAQ